MDINDNFDFFKTVSGESIRISKRRLKISVEDRSSGQKFYKAI